MQARLDGGAFYIALDIFTADLRRMCANARIYNAAHTIYVQYANRARRPTIILTPPHACRRALALTAARAHRLRACAPRRAAACLSGWHALACGRPLPGAQLRRLCPLQIEAFLDQYLLAHVVPKA